MSLTITADEFHAELTARNRGLIGARDQARLRRTRVVVAGCGSTGGACVLPLVRSGAERLVLLDPGVYELSNLNRQDATVHDIGRNKAEATAARVLAVNPFASVEVHPDGVQPDRITAVLAGGDVVIDAVDVTTDAGVQAKLALHRAACDRRVPVLTAYDIATTQLVELFDYRRLLRPLRGRVAEPTTPDELLRALIPPRSLPHEIFPVLLARRRHPGAGFPQLASTATLLGALVVPYLLRVLAGRPVRTRLRVDLADLTRPRWARIAARVRRDAGLPALLWRLR